MIANDRKTLIDRLAGDLRPVKVVTFASAYARCLGAVFSLLFLAVIFAGARPDYAEKARDWIFLVFSSVAAFGSLMSLGGALALGFPAFAETRARHLVWFGAVPLLLGAVASGLAYGAGASSGVFTVADAECGAILLGMAAIPFFVFTAQVSKLAPFRSVPVAFASGAAALSVGTVFLQWHCPNDNGFHAAVWHFLPVVPIAALSALATRRIFGRWRDSE